MLFLLSILAAGLLIILKLRRVFNYWKDRGVEYVSPLRCFRALSENIIRINCYSGVLKEIYDQFPDKRYIGFYHVFKPVLLVRDLELFKQITTDHDVFYMHSEIFPPELDPLWSKNLVVVTDQHAWRAVKTSLTPLFSRHTVKTSFAVTKQFTDNFVNFLTKQVSETNVEMREICKRLLCDITTTYCYGVNCDAINNPDSEMYGMAEKSMTYEAMGGLMAEFFPKLLKWTGTKVYSEDVRQFFTNIMRQSTKMQLENDLTVINVLLQQHKIKKPDIDDLDGIELEDIMAQALVLMFAGYETVCSTLAALIYELTMNPDVQKQLYGEIVKTVKNHDVSYRDITSISYLDDVINEIIRMHPTNAVIDRRAMENYRINAKNPDEKDLILEKGITVWALSQSIQTDPKYFSNPIKFNPGRFSKENRDAISPYSFTPFGSGRRMCLGYRYGTIILKLVITELLVNFELLPTEKTYIDDACNMYKLKQHGVWVKLNPRK